VLGKLEELEKRLADLEDQADPNKTGVAESANIYEQLQARAQALRARWEGNITEKFSTRSSLGGNRLKNYESFYSSLEELKDFLDDLRTDGGAVASLGSLSDTDKKEIEKLMVKIEGGRKFFRSAKIPEADRQRLKAMHERLKKEVVVILGTETEESDLVFTKRVKDWLKWTTAGDYNQINSFWQLYKSDTTFVLEDDVDEMKAMGERLQMRKAELEKQYRDGDRDVEYHSRMNAMQILLNRLQEMIGGVGGEKEKSGGEKAVEGGILTEGIVLREEIAELSSGELIRRARFLWGALFSGLKMPTDQSKEKFYNKYKSILSLLKTRGKKYKEEAEYLDLRLKFYEVLVVGTSSAWTVDYDAMYEGGLGWNGFKTQAEITEAQVMQLLYGSEMRINLEDISSPEEIEFYGNVHNSLKISCELFAGYDPEKDEFKGVDGPFHAYNVNYTEDVRDKFKATVEKMLLEELQQSDPEKTELTEKEKEATVLANQLVQFLDLRTYYSLMTYFVGKSPKSGDPIGATLSKYSNRFGGFKDLYKAIGKNTNGFVIVEALVRQIPQAYIDSIESSPKKINNLLLSMYATDLYDHFYAGSGWDDEVANDDERVIYKGSETQNPVPLQCEAYWVPRTRYVKNVDGNIVPATLTEFKAGEARRSVEEDSGISLNIRNAILNAAGSPDASGGNIITAKGYLEGAAATEKFIEEAKKAFPISGDPHEDIEEVADKIVSLAEKLSPSKSMAVVEGALDNRRLANYLLLCIRFSCLAFGEKYAGDEDGKGRIDDYFRLYGRYLAKISSGLSSAATADIRIEEKQLPIAFRKKYGFPLEGPIKISDYVQQLIPGVKEKTLGSAVELRVSDVSEQVENHVLNVLSINPIQHRNNEEELEELMGERKMLLQVLKEKGERAFRAGLFTAGEVSPLLHLDVFTPLNNGDARLKYTPSGDLDMKASRAVFMRAISLPPLIGDKSIKDEED